MATAQDKWDQWFNSAQRVVVYIITDPDTVTVLGYYSTVSAANTAAEAAGTNYHVSINWWHPDFTHISDGVIQHRDARADLPAWFDADPAQ
jgi:hypothetical protein